MPAPDGAQNHRPGISDLPPGLLPEFTSCVIVAYARAAYRLYQEGQRGCKTVFDIAPAYLSAKDGAELRRTLL